MKSTAHTITTLPPSPDDERRKRMIEYGIMMGIRVLCVVACIWVRGWWLLIPAMGAVFLPYFAVVVANATSSAGGGQVERPGALVRQAPEQNRDEQNRNEQNRNEQSPRTGGEDEP
jgi:hypothetical protein